MRKMIAMLLFAYIPFSHAAWADMKSITTVPTGWKLENSVGGFINAYNTGTTCPNGRLRLETGITEGDKNRFWSTIMYAKTTGASVTVHYDPTLEDCQLIIFQLN